MYCKNNPGVPPILTAPGLVRLVLAVGVVVTPVHRLDTFTVITAEHVI